VSLTKQSLVEILAEAAVEGQYGPSEVRNSDLLSKCSLTAEEKRCEMRLG
jgi:hypothetical protein